MSSTRPAVVAVAADDRALRARMARALASRPQLLVRPSRSARDLVARECPGDALVVSCRAIDGDDLALLKELRAGFPEVPVVAVCETINARSVRRAIRHGIAGVVTAEDLGEALAPTVEAVLAGQIAMPREVRDGASMPVLSFREKQILAMVVMGFSNREIGSRLFLADTTVKTHLSSAFKKLDVSSRSEAAALILDPEGSVGAGILAITGTDARASFA